MSQDDRIFPQDKDHIPTHTRQASSHAGLNDARHVDSPKAGGPTPTFPSKEDIRNSIETGCWDHVPKYFYRMLRDTEDREILVTILGEDGLASFETYHRESVECELADGFFTYSSTCALRPDTIS